MDKGNPLEEDLNSNPFEDSMDAMEKAEVIIEATKKEGDERNKKILKDQMDYNKGSTSISSVELSKRHLDASLSEGHTDISIKNKTILTLLNTLLITPLELASLREHQFLEDIVKNSLFYSYKYNKIVKGVSIEFFNEMSAIENGLYSDSVFPTLQKFLSKGSKKSSEWVEKSLHSLKGLIESPFLFTVTDFFYTWSMNPLDVIFGDFKEVSSEEHSSAHALPEKAFSKHSLLTLHSASREQVLQDFIDACQQTFSTSSFLSPANLQDMALSKKNAVKGKAAITDAVKLFGIKKEAFTAPSVEIRRLNLTNSNTIKSRIMKLSSLLNLKMLEGEKVVLEELSFKIERYTEEMKTLLEAEEKAQEAQEKGKLQEIKRKYEENARMENEQVDSFEAEESDREEARSFEREGERDESKIDNKFNDASVIYLDYDVDNRKKDGGRNGFKNDVGERDGDNERRERMRWKNDSRPLRDWIMEEEKDVILKERNIIKGTRKSLYEWDRFMEFVKKELGKGFK